MAREPKSVEIPIVPISQGSMRFFIVGMSPMIHNRVAEKAQRELLFPAGRRRSAADRAGRLKHDPLPEYRASAYKHRKDDQPTRLFFPAPAFHGAMSTAALDLPGTKKTEIGRLVWVEQTRVNIYGVPQLYMAIVRNADQNRTPDVRTRAILPRWCCVIDVNFIRPKLTEVAMAHLTTAAGIICGIGDGRQEKGKLSFGQFKIVESEKDPEFAKIVAEGCRGAQDEALEEPECYDDDTAELYSWFGEEFVRRGGAVAVEETEVEEEEVA